MVKPNATLSIITSDPDDNRSLECALEAGADYIATGDDRHLLTIPATVTDPPLDQTMIITPRQFMERLEREE